VLLTCDAEGTFPAPTARVDCFVLDTAGGTAAVTLVQQLREAGLSADRAYDGRSMKSQMKTADHSGARLALIIGEDELAAGTVTVRDLASSEQTTVDVAGVVAHIRKALPR
jgi:histidyl-tRNA synthetase